MFIFATYFHRNTLFLFTFFPFYMQGFANTKESNSTHRRTGTFGPGGAETLLPEKKNGMGWKPNKQA